MRGIGLIGVALVLVVGCNREGENSVAVYNAPPSVSFVEPTADSYFSQGDTVRFQMIVSDDGGVQNLELHLNSSEDGQLELLDVPDDAGNLEYVSASLSIGDHVITLQAVDQDAASGEAQLTVHVEGVREEPSINVTRPIQNDKGEENVPFSFEVMVSDAQDLPNQIAVTLASEPADGSSSLADVCSLFPNSLGEASCSEVLPVGEYVLTFVATDTEGYTNSVQVAYSVVSALEIDNDGDGYTELGGDCNDGNPAVYSGAPEVCDGVDNDCNEATAIDEGTDCFDDDGDGYTENEGDCDDANPSMNPGAVEVLDGLDNDCDGSIDEGTVRFDDDGDGYCEAPPCTNTTNTERDCNDGDFAVSPVGFEQCDGIDNNCNNVIDEENSSGCSLFYSDGDGDGYGVPGATKCFCGDGQAPWTGLTGDDCYDGNPNAHPGQGAFFTLHRGDGKFDYNCDASEELQLRGRTTGCDVGALDWLICDMGSPGWKASDPGCGQSGQYLSSCNADIPYSCVLTGVLSGWQSGLNCAVNTSGYCKADRSYINRVQACR